MTKILIGLILLLTPITAGFMGLNPLVIPFIALAFAYASITNHHSLAAYIKQKREEKTLRKELLTQLVAQPILVSILFFGAYGISSLFITHTSQPFGQPEYTLGTATIAYAVATGVFTHKLNSPAQKKQFDDLSHFVDAQLDATLGSNKTSQPSMSATTSLIKDVKKLQLTDQLISEEIQTIAQTLADSQNDDSALFYALYDALLHHDNHNARRVLFHTIRILLENGRLNEYDYGLEELFFTGLEDKNPFVQYDTAWALQGYDILTLDKPDYFIRVVEDFTQETKANDTVDADNIVHMARKRAALSLEKLYPILDSY